MKHYNEYDEIDNTRILVGGFIVLVLIALTLFLLNHFLDPAFATNEACFCHNINHNPVTICTSNPGQINGHTNHQAAGDDTFGECATPTPTISPIPSPTDSITPTPYLSPTPLPTPTPSCEQLENCEPEITPEPTPEVPFPQPDNRQPSTVTTDAPVCTDSVPGGIANIFVSVGVPNDNKLEVRWTPVEPKGNKAHILYGEYGREFEHALLNTDNDGSEVIGGLKNGINYRFKVAQMNSCAVGEWSNEFDPRP